MNNDFLAFTCMSIACNKERGLLFIICLKGSGDPV